MTPATNPAEPARRTYTVAELELFPSYTYTTFFLAFGFPPPYDPAKFGGAVKNWIDPGVDPTKQSVTYGQYELVAGQHDPQKVPFEMTPLEAMTYNIPPSWPLPQGANPQQVKTPHRDLASNEAWSPWCGLMGIIINRTDL